MRYLIVSILAVCATVTIQAHFPDRENKPVHRRIDVIGPLGNHLPMSYRRRYNRPTYLGGKIAYHIAPSSQEAMAWHDAAHRHYYKDHRPRIVKHFFYPKPWEGLRIGPRRSTAPDDESSAESDTWVESDEAVLDSPFTEPIVINDQLIEQ
jgi:hypothetical protein